MSRNVNIPGHTNVYYILFRRVLSVPTNTVSDPNKPELQIAILCPIFIFIIFKNNKFFYNYNK